MGRKVLKERRYTRASTNLMSEDYLGDFLAAYVNWRRCFMDKYSYIYQPLPALDPDSSYVSIIVIAPSGISLNAIFIDLLFGSWRRLGRL